MKTNYQYENAIKQKLEQVAAPDVNDLWHQMEARLDAEMPAPKSKRPHPFIGFNTSNLMVFLGVATIATILITKSVKQIPATSISKLHTTNTQVNTSSIEDNKATNSNNFTASQENNTINLNSTIANHAPVSNNSFVYHQPGVKEIFNIHTTAKNSITAPQAEEQVAQRYSLNLLEGSGNNTTLNISSNKNSLATPFILVQPKSFRKASWLDHVVAGISLNYITPLQNQEANYYYNGKDKASIYDYMPAVFVQYHLSKKVYVQAEVKMVSPQFISNTILYNKVTELNPDEKEQDLVKLNKLYYTNIPVSVHYSPTPRISIGAGVQYSRLRQMNFTNEQYYSVKSGTTWNTMQTAKETFVRAVPSKEAKANTISSADTAAVAIKPTDMRITLDAGYNVGRFNIGARYTAGVGKYYDDKVSPNVTPMNGTNKSMEVFLKVNLFDKRKY